jgi:hypothetical protein
VYSWLALRQVIAAEHGLVVEADQRKPQVPTPHRRCRHPKLDSRSFADDHDADAAPAAAMMMMMMMTMMTMIQSFCLATLAAAVRGGRRTALGSLTRAPRRGARQPVTSASANPPTRHACCSQSLTSWC